MFQLKTTMILGAGASCSYGYPLADELIDRIINIAQSNTTLIKKGMQDGVLSEYVTDPLVTDMASILSFYDPLSIDAFLTHYKDQEVFVEAVKIIIAEIITSSGEEHLFHRGAMRDHPKSLEKTHWYRFLWNSIVDGLTADELASEHHPLNFDIITFNYDTSLEYFLYSRVNSDKSFLSEDQKLSFLNKLKDSIHHVYGSFFQYEWTGGEDPNTKLKTANENKLIKDFSREKSSNIYLIDERDSLELDVALGKLRNSEQVIFLGFGFDDTNIGPKVLNLSDTLRPRLEDPNNPKNENWYPIIKYTNVGDSEIINSKIESLLNYHERTCVNEKWAKRSLRRLTKSTKKVYQAISEDFRLNRI